MLFVFSEAFKNLFRSKFTGLITLFSMIFALLLISIIGIVYHTMQDNLSRFQNQLTFWAYFPTEMKTENSRSYIKKIKTIPSVYSTQFISKNKGLKDYYKHSSMKLTEIDKILPNNPLPDMIIIHVRSTKLNKSHILSIKKKLQAMIKNIDVKVKSDEFAIIQSAIKSILKMMIIFAIIIGVVTIILVYNTIRLSIHSKKDVIKTMYLVGSTERFIKSPFILESLIQSFFAFFLVAELSYYGLQYLNSEQFFLSTFLSNSFSMHPYHFYFLAAIAFLMSYSAAWISVKKYLKAANASQ